MNSSSGYILTCLLLLSGLIAVIVLLITVTERPDMIFEEPYGRVFPQPKMALGGEGASRLFPPKKSLNASVEARKGDGGQAASVVGPTPGPAKNVPKIITHSVEGANRSITFIG